MYNISESEWARWLIDQLTGKAQSALLNLTVEERNDWATLVSALNSYFHMGSTRHTGIREGERCEPKNPPTASEVRLKEVMDQQNTAQSTGQANVAKEKTSGKGTSNSQGGSCQKRGTRGGARRRSDGASQGRGPERPGVDDGCWKCGQMDHYRYQCPDATKAELESWKFQARKRREQSGGGWMAGRRPT